MGKPKRAGGKASGYDHVQASDEDVRLPEPPPEILHTGKHLTPATVAEMVRLVSTGVPIPVAATAVGAGSRVKYWAKLAREHRDEGMEGGWEPGESKELYWLEEMERAKSLSEASLVQAISAAAPVDWRAAAWLLERKAAKRWHVQHKLLLEAKAGEKLDITTYSTEKLIAIARGLLPEEDVRVVKALPADVTDAELIDADIESGES